MKQGWEIKKLGECFEYIKNGANIKQERGAGGIPITRIETLSGGVFNRDRLGYADIETIDKYQSYVMESGDLLLSHINSKSYIGRVVVYVKEGDETIIHGMNLLRLKVIPDLISPFYMYYYSQTHKFKSQIANRRKDAVNQSSISVADLKTIDVPVPPREEQERIVEELECLSGVIEKKREQLRELDALAQSIFYQMFGDPITNEKGWEIDRLGNMCDISSSKRIYAHEYCEDGIPFYRGKEITEKSKGNDISVELYIAEDRYNELKHKYGVPQIGDILITAVGTIGNIWVVDNDTPFYFKDGNVLWLQIKDNINPIYFKTLLYNLIDKYKESMANGCAYSALTIVNLKEMQTNKIPFVLQQQFAEKIEKIEQQKKLISQSIKEVEDLFNSRMKYYFN